MKKPNRNTESRYQAVTDACKRYNLCRNSLVKVATDAGAFIKIGRSARIDTYVLDGYLRKIAENVN